MKKKYELKLTEDTYKKLQAHLFPGDGKEAAAIALCGRNLTSEGVQLLIHELVLIPYGECKIRESNLVQWSTDRLIPLLEKAEKYNMSILKIHCHPTWYDRFSETDDTSDKELFSSVYGCVNDLGPHASAVMLPDGSMFARMILDDISFVPMNKIVCVGNEIVSLNSNWEIKAISKYNVRTQQAFGDKTINLLSELKVGVVGCSGTGSPVIELLHRLGVGELVIVDPDLIEDVNLNRIIYSTTDDAINGKYKVNVLKEAIDASGIGTKVTAINNNIYDGQSVINKLKECAVIFGCMDSIDGRHLLNRIATFYLIPYFDLGVKLLSDKKGGIEKIIGVVNYLIPGKSSLFTRGVYSSEELRAASMKRTNSEFYSQQRDLKYIVDVAVKRPAVISVNFQISSLAVNDFLSRIHPYRYLPNSEFSTSIFDITDWSLTYEKEKQDDLILKKYVGRGDMNLPLGMELR